MRKNIFISCLLLIHSFFLIAQSESQDHALNNLATQMLLFPQEKLYVQTDKPYYISGETVFFRAFLLNASSHKPADFSRYVYVELVNPLDSVVIRQQIRPENKLFYGTISLPEDLVQGNYLLRAYTRFMTNLPEDYFFSKPIRIYDPIAMKAEMKAEFEFIKKNQVAIYLQFLKAKTQEILIPERVSIRLNDGKIKQYKPDREGSLLIKQDLADNSRKRTFLIEFNLEDQLFREYIYVPYPENKLEVTFYPEGGNLIAGKLNQIAFKALKSDGTPADIEGAIFDSNDNKLTEFSTIHEGMGNLFLETLPEEKYYAVCNMGDQTFRTDLPEPKSDTYSLKTQWRLDKLWISINKSENLPQQKLYLFIHSRGNILYFDEWDFSKELITINKSKLPSGVSHLLLLTENFIPLSERLVFSSNDDQISANIQNNKQTYSKREQVKMNIQLTGFSEEDSLAGNFAISVTDDKDIALDTTRNILSEILLTSELRGRIPNSAYYFEQKDKQVEKFSDLLMLTHGWTRYDIPKAMRGDFQYLTVPNEEAQSFSGMVKGGLFSKPYSGGQVSILSMNATFFDVTETDENGKFRFEHFEFPDSTQYIIQALNKKGKDIVELYLDSITYPGLNRTWDFAEKEKRQAGDKGELEDYVEKANLKYTYENGRRMILLPELIIKKSVKKERKYQSFFYQEPDYSISEEEIEKSATPDIQHIISSRFAGVTVYGDKIYIREKQAGIMLDGMILDSDNLDLRSINTADIAQIDIIKDAAKLVIFGPLAYNGLIIIFTKRGEAIPDKLKFNIQRITPLGYHIPVEFYSPQYDTPEMLNSQTPDLRSTIYWKPDVIVNKDGKATLDFYTADSPSTYSVIIEGITPEGKLIYQKKESSIPVE